jgi:adenine-specific DNA-methyltransferase
MQYMGSKQRIASWILDEILGRFPETRTFVDLMSGSGAVAHEANLRGLGIRANDIQPYSFSVLRSAFSVPRDGIVELVGVLENTKFADDFLLEDRTFAAEALAAEDDFLGQFLRGAFDWKAYAAFCKRFNGDHTLANRRFDLFSRYYPNTYFGVRQCLEIDALRQIASGLPDDVSHHLIASLISSMTFISSSTTHLAQYLKPTSRQTAEHLLRRRSKSVVAIVCERLRRLAAYPLPEESEVTNLPYQAALQGLDLPPESGVVYVDPPYFKEHYSRYYHVLDTLALYDFPELTFNKRLNSVTVGRYREQRIRSDFGLRSRVPNAFRELFSLTGGKSQNVALSYASTSLLSADEIVEIARSCGYAVEMKEIQLRHSGQGQSQAVGDVTEYLFLMTHDA